MTGSPFPMGWWDVMTAFHKLRITVHTEEAQIVLNGPVYKLDWITTKAMHENRDTLFTLASGGYALGPCTKCGRGAFVSVKNIKGRQPRKNWPNCYMTPHCKGTHVPRDEQVQAMLAHGVPNPPAGRRAAHVKRNYLLGDWPPLPPIGGSPDETITE